ncbi:unnamed protein product [Rotaria magnacalcarata]|nr:unnamed protein product [Rotaria magnacalcarata]CAF3822821.1 unnamed protein product [Rotaria magnacalcarata]
MHAPPKSLIVYASAPDEAVLGETKNDRNDIFIENLLKYIGQPNQDIEEMMRQVSDNVNNKTDDFQVPYRSTSLTEKIYLVITSTQECYSTAWLKSIISGSTQPKLQSTDINILLVSEAGNGKKTWINEFANYLTCNTLDAALNGEIQVVRPFEFFIFDPTTQKEFKTSFSAPNRNILPNDHQIMLKQNCPTYNFTVAKRSLRLIDTPSMCDNDSMFEYIKNIEHIFMYISQYKHLKGICF